MTEEERRRHDEMMEANRMLFDSLARPLPLRIRLKWALGDAFSFARWFVGAILIGMSAGVAFVAVLKAAGF